MNFFSTMNLKIKYFVCFVFLGGEGRGGKGRG